MIQAWADYLDGLKTGRKKRVMLQPKLHGCNIFCNIGSGYPRKLVHNFRGKIGAKAAPSESDKDLSLPPKKQALLCGKENEDGR